MRKAKELRTPWLSFLPARRASTNKKDLTGFQVRQVFFFAQKQLSPAPRSPTRQAYGHAAPHSFSRVGGITQSHQAFIIGITQS